ncbi:MAG: class I SAM-dependent methyltransferase [Bacteroidota bacterium]
MHYLDRHYDWQTAKIVSIFDELPLWSAAPGQLLLDHLPLAPQLQVLDLGFGTGFPLLHLAQRLGPSSTVYGLDLWTEALKRAQHKIDVIGLSNVHLVEGDAAQIPFPDASLDLITSNLGINNFAASETVVQECYRVLKPSGRLAISSNLVGTFSIFYDHCIRIAQKRKAKEIAAKFGEQVQARSTFLAMQELLAQAGFQITQTVQKTSTMRFLDGTAFLNDHFILLGFMPTWKNAVPAAEQHSFFTEVEQALNHTAATLGVLALEVPIAYVEGLKPNEKEE